MRVLVADDDRVSQRVLELALTGWGHEPIAVGDGTSAWDLLQRPDRPPLALLDWMMPGLEGVDVCRKLRASETGLPVYIILVTSMDTRANIIEGLESGANDYVVKPYDRGELKARIDVAERVIELQNSLANKIEELRDALDHVSTLQGILPICMYCHKIRDDQESWQRIERYISEHSDVKFSHGICDECFEKRFPEDARAEKEEAARHKRE